MRISTGQESEWAKPPAWAKDKAEDKSAIPATEDHVGEGQPASTEGKTAEAQPQLQGQTAPAAQ
jgi:hypothetical protein